MTQVKIQQKEQQWFRLEVTGHAGYAPKGKDIVCAAESILVQALAGALTQMDEKKLHDFAVEGTPGSGCVMVTAVPSSSGLAYVKGMFDMVQTGFYLLAQAYPAHVAVEWDKEEQQNAC